MGRKPGKGTRPKRAPRAATPERREIRLEALREIIERAGSRPLGAGDRDELIAAVETLAFITHELDQSAMTIARLRKLVFGPSSEKTRDVLGGDGRGDSAGDSGDPGCDGTPRPGGETTPTEGEKPSSSADKRGRRKGHGRNGADDYTGAGRVSIEHDSLEHRGPCPKCKGKVYRMKHPAVLVRVLGVAPLEATVYELERLRCNLCGEVFTSRAPPGVGEAKYDETAAAMIALLKYGCGLPLHRLSKLGKNLGIPLPASTQWKVVEGASSAFEPVWDELVRQAAAGDVVHIDDTGMTILSIAKEIEAELATGQADRTGIFTSGVVSTAGERKMAVFFTGREHAGENLAKVLAERPEELGPPIQMCDALSRNTSAREIETLLGNCLVHLRRHFVDVIDGFPDEVARVLKTLGEVYGHEATAGEKGMSADERLAYHQERSGPLMRELKAWLDALVAEKKVEPNSGLGRAIQYFDNHWDALTLFLRQPGAPLDNNVCERALKRAIVHRKNSLFYKTENGAHVGDMYLSLIHTAELCDANPFEYLVAVQRNAKAVADAPDRWMPWSYAESLASAGSDRPGA